MTRIQLSPEHLRIDGTNLADEQARAVPLAGFAEILGPPSRVTVRTSEISTWDDRGLCLHRDLSSEDTLSLTVALGRSERGQDFHPQSLFSGVIEIEGRRLEKGWGAAQLEAAGFVCNPILNYLWGRALGAYDLTLETGGAAGEISTVSIGFAGDRTIELR